MSKAKPSRPRAHLLGLGLDHGDGHKRITLAEDFSIIGGSAGTHEQMTETVVKSFEELKQRGKTLHEVEPRELVDIIQRSTPS